MDLWTSLLDILIILTAAMVLGGICDRLKQSPLLGYLLAGTLLGPNALDLLPSHIAVSTIAELGVALLLFTIGLEFSWRRLRAVGAIALGGGTMQMLVTGALAAGVGSIAGLSTGASVAVGIMIAFSSTAAVVRLLAGRAELDAVYGRNAVGILLLQDIAVVPLMLVIAFMSSGGTAGQVGWTMFRALGMAALLFGALHVVLNYGLPSFLSRQTAASNRDLPILLAIVTALGSAWASHALGFSPVLGAFVAGMLLAESPFATQIRADIVPLQTLFVTLFFSSIGMLISPSWIAANWVLVAVVVVAVVIGKTVVTAGAVHLFRCPLGQAVATGVVLAQVGEFSLVVAVVAQAGQLITGDLFELVVAVLTVTLFLTPYLVNLAPRLATVVGRLSIPSFDPHKWPTGEHLIQPVSGHLVIVGFGPAGQRVAESLMGSPDLPMLVVDLYPSNAEHAEAYGLETHLGDATREEILEGAHVRTAAAVAVTVPDPGQARQIVQLVRSLSPDAVVVVRSRYHIHRWQLDVVGAHAVVDEENEVGLRIAEEVSRRLTSTASSSEVSLLEHDDGIGAD
jgi:CPA2 family monovalent cation:H+ antiporter-2